MDPRPEEPWYRQGWPWFLILLPGSVVVASFVTLWIAISHPQSMVRDDYYREGLAVNRRVEQAEAAHARGLQARLSIDPSTAALSLLITPDDGLPQRLRLALLHPTDAALDTTVELVRDGPGRYAGRIATLPVGRRYLQLGEPEGGAPWLLRGTLDRGGEVELLPTAG
jgi:hypothetical protein